jgi:cytosine/adenosine deaminase-related metal-dependent hydrolase
VNLIGGRVVIAQADAPVLRDTVIELDGTRIRELRPARRTERDSLHEVLMPGLIDAHSHARAISLERHGVADGPLERFLVMLRAMTALDPFDEAFVAGDAGLAAGITATQVAHHSFGDPAAYAAHARAIAAGYEQAGVRAFIALMISDQDEYGPATLLASSAPEVARAVPQPVREMDPSAFAQLAELMLADPHAGLQAAREQTSEVVFDAVGPIAPQWCSAAGNAAAGSARGGGRVHAHLLESSSQRLAATLADPVGALADAGLIGPWSSFAHGIWLDDDDVRRLAAAGATVVHNPGSNRRTGAGRCRVRRLLDAGVNVALGIDSNSAPEEPDPFAEMRMALEVAGELGQPISHAEVLAMATTGGARAVCRPDLGTLRPGATADVIALDLAQAARADDPVRQIVDHARPADVAARWIAGRRREPTGAADARVRLEDALRADARAREQRLGKSAEDWRRVQDSWNTLRAQITSRS